MGRATIFYAAHLLALATEVASFGTPSFGPSVSLRLGSSSLPPLFSARAEADFEQPRTVKDRTVDANVYNIPVEKAAELWTVSVQEQDNADRRAGVPFLDTRSKDFFVDDLTVEVSRDGGLGMELLELAGGRDDGIGVTIVQAITAGGNAEKAGILAGDAIARVTVEDSQAVPSPDGLEETERRRTRDCEARDFEGTLSALADFPGDSKRVRLGVKRLRRWPKVAVTVEYPASQCAEGFDPVQKLEFFAGENLKMALQNRGIVLDDPANPRCDYCGSNACYVSIVKGKHLLNPIGITEKKLMERNPNCRLSCKTTVGYNMQEGDLKLRVNLSQW